MLPLIPIIAGAVSATILIRRELNKKAKREQHQTLVEYVKFKKIPVNRNGYFNPNSRINGKPLLFSLMSDIPLMIALLEYGANPDICSADGIPAMIHAVKLDNANFIIPILLKYGANPNAMDSEGKTAIFYATKLEVIEQLQEAGADINAVDIKGNTALFYSIPKGTTKALVNMGIDVNAKDNEDKSILFYITNTEQFPLLRFLENKGLKVVEFDNRGRQFELYKEYHKSQPTISADAPLLNAIRQNNVMEARSILIGGANPNATDIEGEWNLIDYAICYENPVMIKLLVEHGADVNLAAKFGAPIRHAVHAKQIRCIEQLLELGADPEPAKLAVKYCDSVAIKRIFKKYFKGEL